jgi:hypothetical protein
VRRVAVIKQASLGAKNMQSVNDVIGSGKKK